VENVSEEREEAGVGEKIQQRMKGFIGEKNLWRLN
jgi:hypothetical protein